MALVLLRKRLGIFLVGRKGLAMKVKRLTFYITVFFLCLPTLTHADEKRDLYSCEFFGPFQNRKITHEVGQITLDVWEPWEKYVRQQQIIPDFVIAVWKPVTIAYDEKWIIEHDELFSEHEKKIYKGQFDITTVYFKDNKIQAITLEKEYVGDPITDRPLPRPEHKIVDLYDREHALRKIYGDEVAEKILGTK